LLLQYVLNELENSINQTSTRKHSLAVVELQIFYFLSGSQTFLIAYHLWEPYYHHVPPCSRKTQSTK